MLRSRTFLLVWLATAWLASSGCSHAWDDLDPRLGASVTSAGAGGSGGATSSSIVSSSASATGSGTTASTASSSASGSGGAGAAGGAGGAGGRGGSGGAPDTCPPNGTSTIVDDFDDGTIAPGWDVYASDPSITVDEVAGELVIGIGAATTPTIGMVLSTATYDLTGCRVAVHATEIPSGTGYTALVLYLAANTTSYLEIIEYGGQMRFNDWLDGTLNVIVEKPYDPVAHAWWRLRESSGTVYWETSADGATFTTQATLAPPFPITALQVALTTGTDAATTVPLGTGHFDDLNVTP